MKMKWLLFVLVFIFVFTSCGKKQKTIQKNAQETLIQQTEASGFQGSTNSQNNMQASNQHGDLPQSSVKPSLSPTQGPQASPEISVNPTQASPATGNSVQAKTHTETQPELQLNLKDLNNILDLDQINRHAESLKKEGKDDNAVLLSVADDLWRFFKYSNMLLDVAVADFNNDVRDEIVLLYKNSDNGGLLTLLHMQDGKLVPYGVIQEVEHAYDEIFMVDVITGGTPEVFLQTASSEWPEFALYGFTGSGWEYINLEELGVDSYAQFISVEYDRLSVGSRITSGLYAGNIYQWNGEGFDIIDSYCYDNRIAYKLDCSPVEQKDDQIPEVIDGNVTVSDVYEFISVLGPDRVIQMNPGIYDLRFIPDGVTNEFASWDTDTGLMISNLDNLTIVAPEADTVEIVADYYDNRVISFKNCSNVKLMNLTLGHGLSYGEEFENVLHFSSCRDISIQNCDIYGCGSKGFTAADCTGFELSETTIEECEGGAAQINRCEDLTIERCDIRHNYGEALIEIDSCKGVLVKDTIIKDNRLTKFIEENDSQIEFFDVTWQNNNFTSDEKYNGEAVIDPNLNHMANWENNVKQSFKEYGIPLHAVTLKNQDTCAVFSADLTNDTVYGQPENLKSFLKKIAEAIGYFNFEVEDKKRNLSIRVECTRESYSIYKMDFCDTEPYQNSNLFARSNYEPLHELTGMKIPVTSVVPDEVKNYGKPASYGIFTERESYFSSEYLYLEAVYPGNIMLRRQVGYSRDWVERVYKLQLPKAFSSDILIYHHGEEKYLFDRQNNMIAVLDGDWELEGKPGSYTIRSCFRLKQGSMMNLSVINKYWSEESDILVLSDADKIYKVSLKNLDAVEKKLKEWTVLPNAPSTQKDDYDAVCLQINRNTGVVREYSVRFDSWTFTEEMDYSQDRPGRLCYNFIITENAGTYGIQMRRSRYFRDRDDNGRPFDKKIIDVINLSRPGVLGRYTESMVLFDDFSFTVLDESQPYWVGQSNWKNFAYNRKPIGKVQPEDYHQWREVGRYTEGFEDFVWQMDASNKVRNVREETGDILFMQDMNQTPVKGEVVQILQYLHDSVYILVNGENGSSIYQTTPEFTEFNLCRQYGDQDVQGEFSGATPDEPFSGIDSVKLTRSANPAVYYGALCLEVHSKTASVPVRLVPCDWPFHEKIWSDLP